MGTLFVALAFCATLIWRTEAEECGPDDYIRCGNSCHGDEHTCTCGNESWRGYKYQGCCPSSRSLNLFLHYIEMFWLHNISLRIHPDTLQSHCIVDPEQCKNHFDTCIQFIKSTTKKKKSSD